MSGSLLKNSPEESELWITSMALTKEAVDNLKEIHRQETGEALSEEEAWEMATRLLELAHLVGRRDTDGVPEAS